MFAQWRELPRPLHLHFREAGDAGLRTEVLWLSLESAWGALPEDPLSSPSVHWPESTWVTQKDLKALGLSHLISTSPSPSPPFYQALGRCHCKLRTLQQRCFLTHPQSLPSVAPVLLKEPEGEALAKISAWDSFLQGLKCFSRCWITCWRNCFKLHLGIQVLLPKRSWQPSHAQHTLRVGVLPHTNFSSFASHFLREKVNCPP